MHKVFPPTDKRDIFIYIMLPGKDPEISEEPGTCESGMDGEGIQKTSFSLFFEQNVSKIGWGGGGIGPSPNNQCQVVSPFRLVV